MKHLSTKILIFILLIVAILSGYNYFQRPFLKQFSKVKETHEAIDEDPVDSIQAAYDQLSSREKVAQLISFPVTLNDDQISTDTQLAWIASRQPGFVTLFGENISATEVTDFSSKLTNLKIAHPPLLAVDHEGGSVQRLTGEGFSKLPSWRESCVLDSERRIVLFLRSAVELSKVGVQLVFAPTIDVAQPGSFIGSRACSSENEVVRTASDYITSFAQYGILSVVKHFPGIGSLKTDPHLRLDTVELADQDTAVFNQVLRNFPNIGVMTTHVVVSGKTNGVPCSLSTICLASFENNFPNIMLFTDALEMKSASLEEDLEDPKELSVVVVQAVLAGNDVLVFGENVGAEELNEILTALTNQYELDENFKRIVDSSVKKILSVKISSEE